MNSKTAAGVGGGRLLILLADRSTVALNDVSIGGSDSFKLVAVPNTRTAEGNRSPVYQSGENVPSGWQLGVRESRF